MLRQAEEHGGVLPVMWLDRGYRVRCQHWLGDRWGGGDIAEVVSLVFDPPTFYESSERSFGYVQINLRTQWYEWDCLRAQHDWIELLSPRIATPMQWRARS